MIETFKSKRLYDNIVKDAGLGVLDPKAATLKLIYKTAFKRCRV
jgi:hypothetical protein